MAINLQKGQTINLRKNEHGEDAYDLSSVTIGLGWDVRRSGFFQPSVRDQRRSGI
jgi:stress response protein SCP2